MGPSRRKFLSQTFFGLSTSVVLTAPALAGMRPVYEDSERIDRWRGTVIKKTSSNEPEISAQPNPKPAYQPEPETIVSPEESPAQNPVASTQTEPEWLRNRVSSERFLFIEDKRSGETFQGAFVNNRLYYGAAVDSIEHLMRDWRRDTVGEIDRNLLEVLAAAQAEFGYDEPLILASGYRTRATNEALLRSNRKVAKNSFHVKGMAADITVRSGSIRKLRRIANALNSGGVGFYPNERFVHFDTGPKRRWVG